VLELDSLEELDELLTLDSLALDSDLLDSDMLDSLWLVSLALDWLELDSLELELPELELLESDCELLLLDWLELELLLLDWLELEDELELDCELLELLWLLELDCELLELDELLELEDELLLSSMSDIQMSCVSCSSVSGFRDVPGVTKSSRLVVICPFTCVSRMITAHRLFRAMVWVEATVPTPPGAPMAVRGSRSVAPPGCPSVSASMTWIVRPVRPPRAAIWNVTSTVMVCFLRETLSANEKA
jgi:hypothetical protein